MLPFHQWPDSLRSYLSTNRSANLLDPIAYPDGLTYPTEHVDKYGPVSARTHWSLVQAHSCPLMQ